MPSIYKTVEVEFEAFCEECGEGICHLVDTTYSGENIRIAPCENCMDARYEEGVEEGRKQKIEEADDKIDELEGELDDLEEKMGDMERLLKEKDGTIMELRERIKALEAKVDSEHELGWSHGFVEGKLQSVA